MRKMGAVVSGDIRIVFREIRAYSLAVHPLKIVISLPILRHRKVKIPGAHAAGPQPLPHLRVGTKNMIGRKYGLRLSLVPVHDL